MSWAGRWALGRWALAAGLEGVHLDGGHLQLGWTVGTWSLAHLMVAGSHTKRVEQLEGAAMRELGWKVGGHLAPGAI